MGLIKEREREKGRDRQRQRQTKRQREKGERKINERTGPSGEKLYEEST